MSEPDKKREAEGERKLPYPKSVFFIVGNEFCERFSYYGMKSILSIYINRKLHFSESKATVIYHTFSMFCYFTPIFGAMIADQLLGKFRTIVYISLIYILGHLLKTLAAVPTLGIPPVEFSLLGLALIAIGTGGIKPCVSAFGGDQFKLPEQERQLQTFFSIFYFAINAGSLISTILTPWIREDVECFGDDTCYSLAFGIPAVLMLVATIIIISGKSLYVNKPPQGSVLSRCFGSVFYALKRKISGDKADHWLDLAKDRYESRLVEDVKCVCRVLLMYLPLPVWWALFDQTGSRWTFQATRMDGVLWGTTIKPDQMQVINPLLILFLIPLFDKLIYPAFAKFNLLKKPLQRMTAGGILTASSFIISGMLELEMEKTYAKIPMVGEAHLNVMNSLPCHVILRLTNGTDNLNVVQDGITIEDGMANVLKSISPGTYSLEAEIVDAAKCQPSLRTTKDTVQILAKSEMVSVVQLGMVNSDFLMKILDQPDDPKKDNSANSRFRVVYELGDDINSDVEGSVLINSPHSKKSANISLPPMQGGMLQSNYSLMDDFGDFDVTLNIDDTASVIGSVKLRQGGVYNILVHKDHNTGEYTAQQFTLTTPNTIHILWLVPQYLVITIGEIMFSVTGLEFSYSQAPDSMKSVLQAAWLLTVAFGNIIVIIVAEAKAFDSQASEFFMFAILMFIDMVIFAVMAYFYTPRDVKNQDIGLETTQGNSGTYNPSYTQDKEY